MKLETKKKFLDKKEVINKNNKNIRIYYFDYLRIICAFFVTLNHVCAKYYNLDINSYKWKIAYYYNGFSRFSDQFFL